MPFAHGKPASDRPAGFWRGPPRPSGERTSPRPQPDGDDTASSAAARAFSDRTAPPLSQPHRPRFPSLPHAAPSGVPGHSTEVLGSRHSPRPLPPCCALPEPGPLRSTRITGLLHYCGPIRHPAGPSWPSRVPGWRVRATDRASRVAAFFLFPACQRQYPGGNGSVPVSLTSQPAIGLPLRNGGSASALAFSRPARRSRLVLARRFAEPPKAALYQSASAHVVTSMTRPSCYQPERQLSRGFRTH